MDYTLKNVTTTLNKQLLAKAKELAENDERTKDGSITHNEVTQLLQEAGHDGNISPEEVRFIAGLTTEANVTSLAKSHFLPINGEIHFKNVSPNQLHQIDNHVTTLHVKNLAFLKDVFSQIGLSESEIATLSKTGLTPQQGHFFFQNLMETYGQDLTRLGPQMVGLALFQTAASHQEGLSPSQIFQIVDQFKDKAFIRTDGYMADYLSGKAYDYKVGDPVLKKGQIVISGIPAGTMYVNNGGVFHAVEKTGKQDDLLELPVTGAILDNVLDGISYSFAATLTGIEHLLSTPIDHTLVGFTQLLNHVATLIQNSPSYAQRFVAMPLAQQQREVAQILTDVYTLSVGANAALKLTREMGGHLGKIPMPFMKVNVDGSLMTSSTTVDIAQANQILASSSSTVAIMGVASNRADFQKYVESLAKGMERPHLKDPALDIRVEKMYRGDAEIGSGSTADALRFEIETGAKVGGVEHLKKVKDYIAYFKRQIKKPDISQHDYNVLKNLLIDLEDSLVTKPLTKQQSITKLEKYLRDFPNGNAGTRTSAIQRLAELKRDP